MCALLRLRVIPFKTYYTYGCALLYLVFFFLVVEFGTSETVFAFLFLVVYTAAPTLYIQASEARPATGHAAYQKKRHLYITLCACCVVSLFC